MLFPIVSSLQQFDCHISYTINSWTKWLHMVNVLVMLYKCAISFRGIGLVHCRLFLNSPPVLHCVLFLSSPNKNHFNITHVSDYNVYKSCHNTSVYLTCRSTVPKSGSSKACLIGRNKKETKCYSAPVHEERRFFQYANVKIPEISVGNQMERFISVSSVRNIWDHLWRWFTYFGQTGLTKICHSTFDKLVHCRTSLHLWREFGKLIKNGKSPIPLGWPSFIGKYMLFHFPWTFSLVSHQLIWRNGSIPHVINTILIKALCPFFGFSQKEAPGSQNSLPLHLALMLYWIDSICRYYHLVSWGIPLIVACLPLINDHYGPAGAWWWVVDMNNFYNKNLITKFQQMKTN